MEMYMKVNDKMTKPMDMEFMFMLMVLNIKDHGKMINSMVKVLKLDPMGPNMKEFMKLEKNQDMGNFDEQREVFMKESLQIIIFMDKEFIVEPMEENM